MSGICCAPPCRPYGGILMCYPLLEERKHVQGHYASLARRLAQLGVATLRFDYYSCGNSEGDFCEGRPSSYIRDASRAAEWMRKHMVMPTVVLGVRYGANIALAVAQNEGLCAVLMWNPVLDLCLFRRELHRQAIFANFAHGRRTDVITEDCIRLAGYEVDRQFLDDLSGLDLPRLANQPHCIQIFLVESPHGRDVASSPQIQSTVRQAHVRQVHDAPFWHAQSEPDTTHFVETCSGICTELFGT